MFVIKEPSFVIRSFKITNSNKIFLTFDDGPDAETTPLVLDLLKKHQCTATFFVIGEKAKKNKSLIERMLQENHSLMSHSIDHDYSHYFKTSARLQNWIQASLEQLKQTTQQESYFFRPPAGVINPPLLKAAQRLKVPLLLWNQRFYDSLFRLTKSKIDQKIKNFSAGDIILLHDRQKMKNRSDFISSLEYLILNLKEKNLKISAISKSEIDLVHW